MTGHTTQTPPPEGINFEKIFKTVLRNLWLFIIFLILAFGLAYMYIRYTIPTYRVAASVLIKDQSKSASGSMEDLFGGNLFGNNQNLQNELLILKSYPIVEKTIQNLDLEVLYYQYKNYQYHDAYKSMPFKVIFFKEHPQLIHTIFNLQFEDDGTYVLSAEKQDAPAYNYLTNHVTGMRPDYEIALKGQVGEIMTTPDFQFLVVITSDEQLSFQKQYAFKLTTNEATTDYYKNALQFNMVNQSATIVEISLDTKSVELGRDIINELIKVYSAANLEEKNHMANMTINYIESQLEEVSKSLNMTEDSLQQFLSENRLINVEEQATGMSEQLMELRNQQAELMAQKRYFSYVADYLKENNEETQIIAPASMGVDDPLLNKLIVDLSTAQSNRSNLIENNQANNPMVKRLAIQINNLKNVIRENITSAQNSNSIAINELQSRIKVAEAEISKLPKTRMQLGGIERKYQVHDAIYNFLLQKHAEAKITKASNLPDNMVVEPAKLSGYISPNVRKIYLIAFVLGSGFPLGILLLIMALKTKIESREDLEHITNAPILGTILHNRNKKESNIFKTNPQSNIAESYRTLRTNLNFYLKKDEPKCILMTSSVSGEGKSFSAVNMAGSYASLGEKTILVNCDIRKSTPLQKVRDKKTGLSTYLSGYNTIEEIIQDGEMDNLSYIPAGSIPPNPMELLASSKTKELFNYLQSNYDCIILDTTPMAQITDAYMLIPYASMCIVVTRYKFTRKKILRVVLKDLKQKGIDNVGLILNDNKLAQEQYGYGYGYYGSDKKGKKRSS
ncbi:GumC family protein [Saccharicrinis sp. FJH54]|uniref:GumC family protein n=1 Tax=Saccharicrinis sp. FJH54 TaxID=3344665 RepID=UPI0035D52549